MLLRDRRPPKWRVLSGTGDSQRDSRESIRAKAFAMRTPIFIARQADSHESFEFPIRANHPIRANRANRFARIMPLREGFPHKIPENCPNRRRTKCREHAS